MRVVIVNLVFDRTARDSDALLDHYPSLTELATALARGGAKVDVIQRCPRFEAASTSRNDVDYYFVVDESPHFPATWFVPPALFKGRLESADIVHVNGLMFPATVAAMRAALPASTRIVVQDHAGMSAPSFFDRFFDSSWRGLAQADAYSFTAAEYAKPWRDAGLLNPKAPVFEIVEASTTLVPIPRDEARARTQLTGNPLLLWVGRLNQNKDPLTVLRGIAHAFDEMQDGHLCMVYSDATLEADVRSFVDGSPQLRQRVTLTWRVPHDAMPLYYSSADYFVSGSHREGSGYALIEALACGVIPVVTDIPSFRVIAGECGVRWQAGYATSLHHTLMKAQRLDRTRERARVRKRFERELTWDAIAAQTLAAYRTLLG